MQAMPLSTTQKLRWGLYGATVLAGVIVVIGFLNTTELTRRAGWVRHSASIVTELEVLLARVTDAETGQRGFLLTRDPRYLELYHQAGPGLEQKLATLAGLLGADTAQHAALDSLRPLLRSKLTELQRTIVLDSVAGGLVLGARGLFLGPSGLLFGEIAEPQNLRGRGRALAIVPVDDPPAHETERGDDRQHHEQHHRNRSRVVRQSLRTPCGS